MPLYEYQCVQCGERVEIIQRFSEAPHTECEKCGGELKKLMSAPAIQFKGSGWYKNDYAAKPAATSTSETKTETNTETKTETKSETKSESKSESKSEAKTSE